MTEIHRGVECCTAENILIWRDWFRRNHSSVQAVWLIIYKKESGIESIDYNEAVDEALCWGWVDSKVNKRDSESYYQYFAKRNPKSNWSRINKNKIAELMEFGRMQIPGLEMVEIAKETGTWTALEEVENLVIPKDMMDEFGKADKAFEHWNNFPRSVKRGILEWIFNAKRPDTRAKRIKETVEKAEQNERANQYSG